MTGKRYWQVYRLVLALSLVLGAAGCAGTAQADVLRSEKPRLAPKPIEIETEQLVAGNSAFAFDLYQALRQREDGNLFYSPYSISLALAMTYAGARGETEQQMAAALRFALGQERLHPTFNALNAELAKRGLSAEADQDKGFQLNVLNSLWGQKGYEFLPAFLDLLAEQYGAGLRTLDFGRAPEESRLAINRWVGEQTNERITDLIQPGQLPPVTRLVLVNAIYFNAAWSRPFPEWRTHDGPFYLLDDGPVTVPMMEQTELFSYARGQGIQALELPYEGAPVSMVILLPLEDGFSEFEATLDAARVKDILSNLSPAQVALTMPRFEFDSGFELAEPLKEMGAPDAFSDGVADFSGMDGTRRLYIGQVVHKALVAVDEEGTEAAAATAVIMIEKEGGGPRPIEMTVDRPFIFLIRDVQTGTILFLGRVVDPSV